MKAVIEELEDMMEIGEGTFVDWKKIVKDILIEQEEE